MRQSRPVHVVPGKNVAERNLADLDDAIALYKRLCFKLKGLERSPSFLVGPLGEMLVEREMRRKKFHHEWKGGQSKFDFVLGSGNTLEVKTSRVKNREGHPYPEDARYYGWKAQGTNEETPKADYYAFVALDDRLKSRFFILTRDEVEKLPIERGRFSKRVLRRLHIFLDAGDLGRVPKPGDGDFERRLTRHPSLAENRWDKLKA